MSRDYGYAERENCRIMLEHQAAVRKAYEARIDAELRRGPYAELYRRGLATAAEIRQEARQHKLSVEHLGSGPTGLVGWYAACSCGWRGYGNSSRKLAERYAAEEREHIFRPLSASVEHSAGVHQVDAA
jgi:hypothetical protein